MNERPVSNAPRVAILGAGPIGVEAALEGARRGYDVALYDSGRVAEYWRRFAGVSLFTPFRMNSTERGRARLRETGTNIPADDAILTAGEIVNRYLEPVVRLPELTGRVRAHSRVALIAREGLTKSEAIMAVGDRSRVGRKFLLRVETDGAAPRIDRADVVIDATGVYATPRATGPGGLPAPGEEALGTRIDRHIVSITGETRARYAGKRILLVGDGHSAATALVDLEALAKSDAPPSVTWIRRRGAGADTEPFEIQANDPLPERANLANRANRIAREAKWLATFAGAEIESYALKGAAVLVTIREAKGGMKQIEADQILALVGYRPDASIHRELQIHLCYASEAPMALATAMLTASIATPSADSDCLNQTTHGAETLRTPEPGFFLAGAKSYGRSANFLLSVGHRQIEEIYGLIETDVAAPSVLASP